MIHQSSERLAVAWMKVNEALVKKSLAFMCVGAQSNSLVGYKATMTGFLPFQGSV